jgi:hypothetical protein
MVSSDQPHDLEALACRFEHMMARARSAAAALERLTAMPRQTSPDELAERLREEFRR